MSDFDLMFCSRISNISSSSVSINLPYQSGRPVLSDRYTDKEPLSVNHGIIFSYNIITEGVFRLFFS